LADGVLNHDLYGALVVVVLATTLLSPPLLRWRIKALDPPRPPRVSIPMPPGGWLRVGERVELVAEPSDADALMVALDAARLVNSAPPSDALLDWLGRVRPRRAPWVRPA